MARGARDHRLAHALTPAVSPEPARCDPRPGHAVGASILTHPCLFRPMGVSVGSRYTLGLAVSWAVVGSFWMERSRRVIYPEFG